MFTVPTYLAAALSPFRGERSRSAGGAESPSHAGDHQGGAKPKPHTLLLA